MRKILFFFVALTVCSFAKTPHVVPVILDSIPHEQNHFTQGLFFDGNDLIETTGQYGRSGLYRKMLSGKVLDSVKLAKKYFGEGSVAVGDDLFYLTWREHKAFIYDRKTFKAKGEFSIPTEGWGLAYWKSALLMSNGSSELLQIAPGGFQVVGVIPVKDEGRALPLLNELEVVGDTLYANVWQTAVIAVIELPTGNVVRYLDFTDKVLSLQKKYPKMDVLNGIAFYGTHLLFTGKLWPWIYKISY